MIKKTLKLLSGILLLPAVIFAVINFCKEITDIPTLTPAQAMFMYGFAAYVGIHIFIYKLDFLYVFGHESTHALTAKLFGGKIFSFKVSSKGGSVKTDKANTSIALMPYLFPFYALVVCLIYVVFSLFRDARPYVGYFVFALGMSLSFHLVQTAEFLRQKQSDIVKSGYVFSMPLIILVNIAIIGGILSLLFIEFSFKDMAVSTFNQTRDVYVAVWRQVFR